MELIRQNRVATRIVFPLINATNSPNYYTSAVEFSAMPNNTRVLYTWKDSENPVSATVTNYPIQIGNTGLWYLNLTSAEMSPDNATDNYMVIKLSAAPIEEQTILIHLTEYNLSNIADTSNRVVVVTNLDKSNYNVSSINAGTISNATLTQPLSADLYLWKGSAPSELAGSGRIEANVGAVTDGALVSADFGADYYNRLSLLIPQIVSVSSVTTPLSANVVSWRGTLPNNLVSSRVDVSVGAMANNTITSNAITNGALTSAEFGTDYFNRLALIPPSVVGVSAYQNFPSVNVSSVDVSAMTSADFGEDYYDKIASLSQQSFTAPNIVGVSAYYNFPEVSVSSTTVPLSANVTHSLGTLLTSAPVTGRMSVHVGTVGAGVIASGDFDADYWSKVDELQPRTVAVSAYQNFPSVNVSSVNDGALVSADFSSDYYDRVQLNLMTSAYGLTLANAINANIDGVETKVDTIDTNVDTIVSKLPPDQIASETSVTSITNNTRFVSTLPASIIVPLSGSSLYLIKVYYYNTSGTMEDPDGNSMYVQGFYVNSSQFITSANLYWDDQKVSAAPSTSAFTPQYYKMFRIAQGQYGIYYDLSASVLAPDQIMVDFAFFENSVSTKYARTVTVFDDEPGTAVLADNDANKNVIADAFRSYDATSIPVVAGSIEKNLTNTIGTISATTLSADIRKVNGTNVVITDFKNTTAEMSAAAVSAINYKLSFSGNNVNVRVADKGILNDITVAQILSGGVDTQTVGEVLEMLMAYATGRIVVQGNKFIYYKQDNSTSAFSLSGTNTERTRPSSIY